MESLNSNFRYIIDFIVFEGKTKRPELNKGDTQYLIKWQNYDFSECTFIHATSIDNKKQKNAPFFNWNQLTKEQKEDRAKFCEQWENKTKEQKKILGVKYMQQFKQSMNISISRLENKVYKNNKQSQILNNDQISNEFNLLTPRIQESIIPPRIEKSIMSPPRKKRKIDQNFKSTTSMTAILLLATYKDPNKKTIFNSRVDLDYFKSISYSEKQYPSNSFVHWIMINKKKTIKDYIQQKHDISKTNSEIVWLEEKIKNLPFKNYVAYPIIKHGVIENIKVPDYVNSRQNKFIINETDIKTIFKNNQYIGKLLNDNNFNIKFYGVTCDYKMISLIADEKKKLNLDQILF